MISIIIPVFNNTKDEIIRCIKSTDNPVFDDVEIIVIDDGSSSDCASYLDEIARQYRKIKVYHTLNKGVSAARNFGVNKSKGQYICFLDADDFLTDQFWIDLRRHINDIKKYSIIYGLVYPRSENTIKNAENKMKIIEKADKALINKLYRHMFDLGEKTFIKRFGYISRGPVARLVRRDIALQIKFDENLSIGEDMIWNLKILQSSNSIGIIYNTWYIYVKNYHSVTHSFSLKYIDQYRNMLNELWNYANSEDLKFATLNKTYQCLREIADAKFNLNNSSFLADIVYLNHIASSFPFSKLWEEKHIILKYATIKNLILLFLYRIGVLFIILKLHYNLRRE